MDINADPLIKQAYDLSLAIEKIDASEQQTNASVLASGLSTAIEKDMITKGDLSMLIRMMVTKHRRGKLDEEYCLKALDYLRCKGLKGNVLRAL